MANTSILDLLIYEETVACLANMEKAVQVPLTTVSTAEKTRCLQKLGGWCIASQ
jgi:hypothetical protein